jgi:hypothetical protein
MEIDISPFELRLLEALRAEPNRAAMWTASGDPARHHQQMLALYVTFFHICNTNSIEYWLEYGSLLGYARHGGIIPWEWDKDIGCTPEHYRRILAAGEALERDDPVWGFRFLPGPGLSRSLLLLLPESRSRCSLRHRRIPPGG